MRRELAYLMDILSAADELARFVADLDLPLLWNLASTQVTELHDQVAAVIPTEFPGAIEDAP